MSTVDKKRLVQDKWWVLVPSTDMDKWTPRVLGPFNRHKAEMVASDISQGTYQEKDYHGAWYPRVCVLVESVRLYEYTTTVRGLRVDSDQRW